MSLAISELDGRVTAVLRNGDQETWAEVVYDGGWLPGAHEFLADHERQLAAIPTWLFASGPLDHVPPGTLAELPDDLVDVIGRIAPRDVALFVGSLQPHHVASGLRG